MIIIDDIEQRSPEWYTLRAGVVTGTGFGILMKNGRGKGIDGQPNPSVELVPYMDSIADEILTGIPMESFEPNKAMQEGIEKEPEARCLYELVTRREVREVAFIYADESRRVGISPDGLGDDFGLEIKCPKRKAHLSYVRLNKCPPEYIPQVQGAMYVTGFDKWDFVSFHPDAHKPLHVVTVKRDPEFMEKFGRRLAAFLDVLHKQLTQQREKAA